MQVVIKAMTDVHALSLSNSHLKGDFKWVCACVFSGWQRWTLWLMGWCWRCTALKKKTPKKQPSKTCSVKVSVHAFVCACVRTQYLWLHWSGSLPFTVQCEKCCSHLSELSGNLYFWQSDTAAVSLWRKAVFVVPAEGEGLIKEVRRRTEARGLLSRLCCHRCHNAGRQFSRGERVC